MLKRAILPVRLSSNIKKIIENAATHLGISVSAFMVQHAYLAARDILKDDHLVLSDSDWALFTSSMENPPEPNSALCALFSDVNDE